MHTLETPSAYFINGICVPKLRTFFHATPVKFWLIWALCMTVMVLGWNQVLNPEFGKPGEWFQRAGSLVVGFALMAEFSARYTINKLMRDRESNFNFVNARGMGRSASQIEIDKVRDVSTLVSIEKICEGINIFFVFIGTIVWGYGDIAFYGINAL